MSKTVIKRAILPFLMPGLLASPEDRLNGEYKRSRHKIFRRLFFKRRLLLGGDYEPDWQEIESWRIMNYGSVKWQVDDKKVNYFDQSGVSLRLGNDDGYFSDNTFGRSFWHGYQNQMRTLVKIESGYMDHEDGIELPVDSSMFYGIITRPIKQSQTNIVSLKVSAATSVFDEIPASDLDLSALPTNTASEFITLVKDHRDAFGNYIFRNFISAGAWDIDTTTNPYTHLTTQTSLSNLSCLKMIRKFAESENFVFYVDQNGRFKFISRGEGNGLEGKFFGGTRYLRDSPHNIIMIDAYGPEIDKTYNRVRVKHLEASTETSYYTKEESWTWGDSSSSYINGVRTLKINNVWLNSATAAIIGDNLFAEFQYPKNEIRFTAKFTPDVNLLDGIEVTNQYITDTNRWNESTWNGTIWSLVPAHHNEFRNASFIITAIENSFDKFTTKITGRAL